MLDFFTLIRDFWVSIIAVFDSRPLQIGNYSVSLFAIIFSFIVIGLVVSVFWRGARS